MIENIQIDETPNLTPMISCIPKNMESQRVVNGLGVAKNKIYHSTSHCIKEKINPGPRKAYNVKNTKGCCRNKNIQEILGIPEITGHNSSTKNQLLTNRAQNRHHEQVTAPYKCARMRISNII